MDALTITPETPFEEAADRWMRSRMIDVSGTSSNPRYIKLATEKGYRKNVITLKLFFRNRKLNSIMPADIKAYQRARSLGDVPFIRLRRPGAKAATPCPVKPQKVNQEIALLARILKCNGCWNHHFEELYDPLLAEVSELPRALSAEEQAKWLRVSGLQERWSVVHWYSVLAIHTSMSTNELRGLRIGDVNLQQRILSVPPSASKTRYRTRTIPIMTAEALWAAEKLLDRAARLGSVEPRQYLFPFRICRNVFDPTRPMGETGIRKAWDEVREATGLKWFRPYDTRHTAITRLAEEGVPLSIIMARAGHLSARMTEYYTHISEQVHRSALTHAFRQASPKPDLVPAVDPIQSMAQAEIAKQVAAALAGFFANLGKVTT